MGIAARFCAKKASGPWGKRFTTRAQFPRGKTPLTPWDLELDYTHFSRKDAQGLHVYVLSCGFSKRTSSALVGLPALEARRSFARKTHTIRKG